MSNRVDPAKTVLHGVSSASTLFNTQSHTSYGVTIYLNRTLEPILINDHTIGVVRRVNVKQIGSAACEYMVWPVLHICFLNGTRNQNRVPFDILSSNLDPAETASQPDPRNFTPSHP